MSQQQDEPSVIEQVTHIAASPETVWTFWTDPERLCEWWGVAAEVVAVTGGTFRVTMADGPVMRGEFVALEPPHRLVFTFGWEQNADQPLAPGSTRVEVRLVPDNGQTVLTLRHFDVPPSHAADHRTGWHYFVGEQLVAAVAAHAS